MNAGSDPSPGLPFRPRSGALYGRLAVAVIVSALLHLWVAARMPVGGPGLTLSHRAAMIVVRLGPPVRALEALASLPPDPTAAEKPFTRQNSAEGGAVPTEVRHPGRNHERMGAAPHSSAPARPPAAPPTLEAAPPSEPDYYAARELDVYPALLQPLRLTRPEGAPQNTLGGRVLAEVLIDDTGLVNEVRPVKAEPAGYFEEAARITFATARFSAARKDGRPVKSRVLVDIRYDPVEAEHAAR
jgi:TonB-like protein